MVLALVEKGLNPAKYDEVMTEYRDYMAAENISVKDVAAELGVSGQTVRNVLAKPPARPVPGRWAAMSTAVGWEPGELAERLGVSDEDHTVVPRAKSSAGRKRTEMASEKRSAREGTSKDDVLTLAPGDVSEAVEALQGAGPLAKALRAVAFQQTALMAKVSELEAKLANSNSGRSASRSTTR